MLNSLTNLKKKEIGLFFPERVSNDTGKNVAMTALQYTRK